MARNQVNIVLKATDEASKVFQNVANNTLPQFTKRVAQLAVSFASVAAVERTLRTAITNALEAEKAVAGLTAALNAQGHASAGAVRGLEAQAKALSRLTLADDEAILGAQQILVSIGKLRGDALDRATKSALDLAAGLGIDLAQAATILAKAAQGSTRELTRLGFEFRKGSTDAQILEQTLAQVNQRFAGMAEAEIKTSAGQIHELSEAFGELLETLGTKLITGANNVSSLTRVLQVLNDEATDSQGIGFWTALGAIIAGKFGAGGGLAEVEEHVRLINEHAKKLAENMAEERLENPMVGYKDAAAEADKKVKDAAEEADRLAKATEAAEKAAKKAAEEFEKLKKAAREANFVGGVSGLGAIPNVGPADVDAERRAELEALSQSFAPKNLGEEERAALALKEQKESWERVLAAIEGAHGGLIQYGDTLEVIGNATNEWALTMQETLEGGLANAAADFGNAMVAAAFGAKVSWSDTIKQILAGLAQVLVRTAIIKAIQIAFTASKGGIVPSNMMAEGGIVYAAGGFRPRGTDTVPAMLTPGEMVIPRAATQAILGGRASLVGAGAGGGPQLVTVKLGGATMTRLLVDNARSVVEVLDYIDARGR